MLRHRVLTALVGVPAILAAIWLGPPLLTLVAAAAAVIGVREAYRLYPSAAARHNDSDNATDGSDNGSGDSDNRNRNRNHNSDSDSDGNGNGNSGNGDSDHSGAAAPPPPVTSLPVLLGGTWAVALVLAGALAVQPTDFGIAAAAIIIAGAVIGALWLIAAWRGRHPRLAIAWLLLPPAYIGGALAAAVALRGLGDHGLWWLLLAILAVYATDTGAYAVGRLLGRHPMAPAISPGKNWEGAAGGLAAAVIAAILMGILMPLPLQVWQSAAIGVILGIVSPVGDLLESKAKRLAGVKDSGNLFPGHGGMLDRLDSLLPSLTIMYLLVAAAPPAG